ncbi:hypothetical protein JEQ12_007818 [Ovis aries]|uniref:Uncharacterized protein n=1 Tax=Ovis aries TaxID=9940 RepID=A0A836CUL3_SHEEP|nr:hypothetical protein JEQ12_007818 [Ovis aries]
MKRLPRVDTPGWDTYSQELSIKCGSRWKSELTASREPEPYAVSVMCPCTLDIEGQSSPAPAAAIAPPVPAGRNPEVSPFLELNDSDDDSPQVFFDTKTDEIGRGLLK